MDKKQIILQEINTRFLFGVKCKVDCFAAKIHKIYSNTIIAIVPETSITKTIKIEDVNLLLFPLSSMTKEQKEEFNNLTDTIEIDEYGIQSKMIINNKEEKFECVPLEDMVTAISWLNSHHFDYNNLIGKGLAVDATGHKIYK